MGPGDVPEERRPRLRLQLPQFRRDEGEMVVLDEDRRRAIVEFLGDGPGKAGVDRLVLGPVLGPKIGRTWAM
jgi:hypothetical protein